MNAPQHVANDNEKIRSVRRFKRFGQSAKPRVYPISSMSAPVFGRSINTETEQSTQITEPTAQPKIDASKMINISSLIIWLACLALLFLSHQDGIAPLQKIGVSVIFGWASLYLLHRSKLYNRIFFKTIGIGGLLSSHAIIGFDLFIDFNIQTAPHLVVLLCIGMTMTIGALTREKLPVLVSAALTAIWIAVFQYSQDAPQLAWGFPAIIGLHYYLGSKLRSPQTLALSCITALAWLGGVLLPLVQNAYIPAHSVLGFLLLLGIAYNRAGKRMQDGQKANGLLHTNLGWCLAVSATLGLQYSLGSVADPAKSEYLIADNTIKFVGIGSSFALLLIIISKSAARIRTGFQSRIETLVILGLVISLTALLYAPEFVTTALVSISPKPTLFVTNIFAGIVTASCIGLLINGARRGVPLMMIIGILALLTELYLILPVLNAQPEFLYAYGYSALFSILFLALFAQYNTSRRSSEREAHRAFTS